MKSARMELLLVIWTLFLPLLLATAAARKSIQTTSTKTTKSTKSTILLPSANTNGIFLNVELVEGTRGC